MLLVTPVWRHNSMAQIASELRDTFIVCVRVCTLDGDLGIGGGPAGLRVWLVASLTLR